MINRFADNGSGAALGVRLESATNVRVLVTPATRYEQEVADRLAGDIDALPRMRDELTRLRERTRDLEVEVGRLSGSTNRSSLFGEAYAREAEDGSVWLLGDQMKGWGAFGFRFESWAEIARLRPSLRPCGAGSDEYGPFVIMKCVGAWADARVQIEEVSV